MKIAVVETTQEELDDYGVDIFVNNGDEVSVSKIDERMDGDIKCSNIHVFVDEKEYEFLVPTKWLVFK
jgi:hypothetical protein